MKAHTKALLAIGALMVSAVGRDRKVKKSALDEFLESVAASQETAAPARNPGSLWSASAAFNDLGRDLRAARVNDLVTVVVYERASAVSSGTSASQRTSAAKATVSVAGHTPRGLNPMADVSTSMSVDGQGSTSRHNELSTTITARVTHALANGDLVVEGARQVGVNSEQQTITLRGIVRAVDLTSDNTVASDRVGMLEVRVSGRGIVGDAVRRPGFLYRLLLGILPF